MTISNMTGEITGLINEASSIVGRLRSANRRLTGETGEEPTQLASAVGPKVRDAVETGPLLPELQAAIETLNSKLRDIRLEVSHLENVSETGEVAVDTKPAYVGRG